MKKYEFTGETKNVTKANGKVITLQRIRAVADFSDVKAGELGGMDGLRVLRIFRRKVMHGFMTMQPYMTAHGFTIMQKFSMMPVFLAMRAFLSVHVFLALLWFLAMQRFTTMQKFSVTQKFVT